MWVFAIGEESGANGAVSLLNLELPWISWYGVFFEILSVHFGRLCCYCLFVYSYSTCFVYLSWGFDLRARPVVMPGYSYIYYE